MKLFLTGASFDTGNLGVSALAESSIKCILNRWPDADIRLFASGRKIDTIHLEMQGRLLQIQNLPVRFSKNIFLLNHFIILFISAVLLKIIRWKRFKKFCIKQNPFLKDILEIDLAVDITGGDSFSDIYGMRRFIMDFLRKWLILLFNKPLIFLPQTYGPFKKLIPKYLAIYILTKSYTIYSRDMASLNYLQEIMHSQLDKEKIHLIPDVAFCLDAKKPEHFDLSLFQDSKSIKSIKIGLNVSGLIFNGGYTKDNMFNLNIDYQNLIVSIIDLFMLRKDIIIILIPHVFPPKGFEVESDLDACFEIYKRIDSDYKNRIFLSKNKYNQNEIKYIISLTDFFLGSRMHSCIGALSQCIPTIGLAYSKKFQGVFETVKMDQYVADMRFSTQKKILDIISNTFKKRKDITNQLKRTIPKIKENVLNIFNDIGFD